MCVGFTCRRRHIHRILSFIRIPALYTSHAYHIYNINISTIREMTRTRLTTTRRTDKNEKNKSNAFFPQIFCRRAYRNIINILYRRRGLLVFLSIYLFFSPLRTCMCVLVPAVCGVKKFKLIHPSRTFTPYARVVCPLRSDDRVRITCSDNCCSCISACRYAYTLQVIPRCIL